MKIHKTRALGTLTTFVDRTRQPSPLFTYDGLQWCERQGGELRMAALDVARRDFPRSRLAREN